MAAFRELGDHLLIAERGRLLSGRGVGQDKNALEYEVMKFALEQTNGKVTAAMRAQNETQRFARQTEAATSKQNRKNDPMLVEVDLNNLLPFPQRIPEKFKKNPREHFQLTQDEIAPKVGAGKGAGILAYENDEDDLLVTVLWNYSKLAGCPIDNLIYDNLEVTFRELQEI